MKVEEIKSVTITLTGDESDSFKSAIKKIEEENKKAGFIQLMNVDEKSIIKQINDSINK